MDKISEKTLEDMDKAMEYYAEGRVSGPVDLKDFCWIQRILFCLKPKRLSIRQYVLHRLEKGLRKSSKGSMPKQKRKELAIRTVNRMDFNNSLQMHKSIEAYADILVVNWRADMDKKYEEFRRRVENVPGSYYGFMAAVMTYVKSKESRFGVVKEYMDSRPDAPTSDILEFISNQPDFYEDTVWPKVTIRNLMPYIKMRVSIWLHSLEKRRKQNGNRKY